MQYGPTATAVVLVVLVVSGGCLAGDNTDTPTTVADTKANPTTILSESSPTTSAVALRSVPSAERCAVGRLPSPNDTDSLTLSPYPAAPDSPTRSTVIEYIVAFEEALFRNTLIAENAPEESNLTQVSVTVEPETTTRYRDGYVIVLANNGATGYASGIHGDHWPTVGYFLNESVLVRAHVDSVNATVGPSNGTTVLDCRP